MINQLVFSLIRISQGGIIEIFHFLSSEYTLWHDTWDGFITLVICVCIEIYGRSDISVLRASPIKICNSVDTDRLSSSSIGEWNERYSYIFYFEFCKHLKTSSGVCSHANVVKNIKVKPKHLFSLPLSLIFHLVIAETQASLWLRTRCKYF